MYCWKALDKGYNFASITSIRGFHTKLWASKVANIPILGILGSHLKVPKQNGIWVLAMWPSTNNTIRGKWWLPPSMGYGESCESVFAHGSFVHQKCFSYTLANLLFRLCKHVWTIYLLVNLPSPHLDALTCFSTPKVLRTKERAPTPSPFVEFTFGLTVESIKELGGAS
jgi:hypothetical protein